MVYLLNNQGCDSIVTLHLTMNYSSHTTDVITACDSLEWINGEISYWDDSTSRVVLTNAVGCDSVIHLHLTIDNGTYTSIDQQACDSYLWNGQLLTSSGVYTHAYSNASGCSSVDTLHLAIHPSYDTTDNVTACDGYMWFDSLYTVSTTAPTHLAHSVYGCDSLVHLSLTVNYSVTDTLEASAESSYTWNGQTYTQSGEYYYYGQTVEGCDSTVVLLLTIRNGIAVPSVDTVVAVKVYPNPTQGAVSIDCDYDVHQVEIYDYLGRRVATFADTMRFDISHLPAGAYTLRLTLARGHAVCRVVKR